MFDVWMAKFEEGLRDELGDIEISEDLTKSLKMLLKTKQSVYAYQFGREVGRLLKSIVRKKVDKIVYEYAKGVAEFTGKPINEVLKSEPVLNFKKRVERLEVIIR